MSDLSPFSGVKRKSDLEAVRSSFLPRLCENGLEPLTRRIVFSTAFFRQKLPVQLVYTATSVIDIFQILDLAV